MRILHVNDEPLTELGGVSRYIQRLMPAQEALGLQTGLVTGVVQHHGIGKLRDLYDRRARAAVAKAALEFGADVVHLHSVLRETSVAVTSMPLPVVMSVHDPKLLGETFHASALLGLLDRTVKSPWERFVARRNVDVFAPVSEELTRRCTKSRLRPAQWLPGPTLLPVGAQIKPSRCFDVVFVGRLALDKGVRQLIEAWLLLDPAHGRLRIVGDGPERANLEVRAAAIKSVSFEGELDEAGVSNVLAHARMVVLPYQRSLRQASSLAALEAAAHGRPLVVGDDPAVVEILTRLGAGTAVEAGDPQQLASAMRLYLDDPQRADREGAAAAKAVLEHYTPDAVARRSVAIYDEAIARHRR